MLMRRGLIIIVMPQMSKSFPKIIRITITNSKLHLQTTKNFLKSMVRSKLKKLKPPPKILLLKNNKVITTTLQNQKEEINLMMQIKIIQLKTLLKK